MLWPLAVKSVVLLLLDFGYVIQSSTRPMTGMGLWKDTWIDATADKASHTPVLGNEDRSSTDSFTFVSQLFFWPPWSALPCEVPRRVIFN